MRPFLFLPGMTDVVVVLGETEKEATVLLLKDRRAVSLTAPIWSEQQWADYIQRRIDESMNSGPGHRTSMRLKENEK